jgi:hypothetical protein
MPSHQGSSRLAFEVISMANKVMESSTEGSIIAFGFNAGLHHQGIIMPYSWQMLKINQ